MLVDAPARHFIPVSNLSRLRKDQRQRERSKGLPFVHSLQDSLFRLDDELDTLVERFQVLIRDDTRDLPASL